MLLWLHKFMRKNEKCLVGSELRSFSRPLRSFSRRKRSLDVVALPVRSPTRGIDGTTGQHLPWSLPIASLAVAAGWSWKAGGVDGATWQHRSRSALVASLTRAGGAGHWCGCAAGRRDTGSVVSWPQHAALWKLLTWRLTTVFHQSVSGPDIHAIDGIVVVFCWFLLLLRLLLLGFRRLGFHMLWTSTATGQW